MSRQSVFIALLAVLAVASGCTEGTGPSSLGLLRVRPVFAPGEEPGVLGISPSEIHLVLRRADGTVVADTSLPYLPGEQTSWLIELETPPENVDVSAELGQGSAIMYSGADSVSLPAGIGSAGTDHDLPVRYLGSGAKFAVDVSPDSAMLGAPGDTRQFTAVARDTSGNMLSGFSFAWVSSHPEVATVNASGLVTAVALGQATIFATAGEVVGSAMVTVRDPRAVSIVVTPDSTGLPLGSSFRFTASVRDAADRAVPGATVSWSSTRVDVATVSDSGVATAVGAGRAILIARLGPLADSATVIVPDPGPGVASIVVTPPSATLTALNTVQVFTAVAISAQGTVVPGVSFEWSSSNTSVATVNSNGVATAIGAGATAIIATANGISGSASLTVSLGPGPPVRLEVLPGSATLVAPGGTQQFTAVAFDARGNIVNVPLSWMTSNPSVASISQTGLATALAAGSSTISAISGTLRGDASLTVNAITTIEILGETEQHVQLGGTRQFVAVVRDQAGNVLPGIPVSWSVDDPTLASITSTGLVSGLQLGITIVRATAGGASAHVDLVVRPNPLNHEPR